MLNKMLEDAVKAAEAQIDPKKKKKPEKLQFSFLSDSKRFKDRQKRIAARKKKSVARRQQKKNERKTGSN